MTKGMSAAADGIMTAAFNMPAPDGVKDESQPQEEAS